MPYRQTYYAITTKNGQEIDVNGTRKIETPFEQDFFMEGIPFQPVN